MKDKWLVHEGGPGMRDILPGKCFYCKQDIGTKHLEDCVAVTRKVKIRVSWDLVVDSPDSWDEEQINFHRNDGSFCGDNDIEALNEIYNVRDRGCSCPHYKAEYLGEV